MVLGKGIFAKSPQAAITQSYNRGETDEFIRPYVIKRGGKPIAQIKDKDAVIFFNLRSDRARQLAKPFVQKDFNGKNAESFKRKKVLKNLAFVAMTDFGPDLDSVLTAFPSMDLTGTLPMVLSGKKQLYLAEKEKYAHITYFLNGGYADPVGGEDRILIPSPDVATYDLTPAMSIHKITKQVLKILNQYEFIAINFAVPDMVAHTGNLAATIQAVNTVDYYLGIVAKNVLSVGGGMIITADHGNAEELINLRTGQVDTEHNLNPAPCVFVINELKGLNVQLPQGLLADVAPSVLAILKIPKRSQMTGSSLL